MQTEIPIKAIEELASLPNPRLYQQAYSAIANRDWGMYFFSFPSEDNSRLQAFVRLAKYLDDKEYWDNVRNIWTGSELLSHDGDVCRTILRARGNRHLLMTPYNRRVVTKLPHEVTIYRGFSGDHRDGMSWTLSKRTAEFFAEYSANGPRRRFFYGTQQGPVPQIVTGVCKKSDIIAVFSDRKEREVVILPESVKSKRVEVWIPKPKPQPKIEPFVPQPINPADIGKVA